MIWVFFEDVNDGSVMETVHHFPDLDNIFFVKIKGHIHQIWSVLEKKTGRLYYT